MISFSATRRYWVLLYSFLFFSTVIYSIGTNVASPFHNNFVTIAYIICLLLVFSFSARRISVDLSPQPFMWLIPILYLGIYLGVYLAGANESVIWMHDSYRVHLPHTQSLMVDWDFLKFPTTVDERFLSFHIISAIIFSIFGLNIYAGGIVLFVGKILTAFFIYKLARKLFNEQTAAIALLIYILVPTVLFYSIVFYKEVYVHLFVVMTYYFSYQLFFEAKTRAAVPLLVSLFLVFNERFYIASFFVITFFLFSAVYTKGRMRVLGLILSVLGCGGIFYLFQTDIMNLQSWRNSYNGYADIDKRWNVDIPYFLAFFKILFTPFFNLRKFELFNTFSYLLIWGSFLNQIAIALMIGGGVSLLKKNSRLVFLVFLPFICFLLLFAYVGPAQGRLRDSFYPIIAIFSGFFMCEMSWFRKLTQSNLKQIDSL